MLEICQVGHLKKKLEKTYLPGRFFLPNLCSNRVCEWKTIGEMLEPSLRSKSPSHLLEEIFRLPDSKSLRLRHAALEMLHSHGVWGSSFKRPPSVCAKTVSSLLRESK